MTRPVKDWDARLAQALAAIPPDAPTRTIAGALWVPGALPHELVTLDGRCSIRRDLRALEFVLVVDDVELPRRVKRETSAARVALEARDANPTLSGVMATAPIIVTSEEMLWANGRHRK